VNGGRAEIAEALLRLRSEVLWRIARKRGYKVKEAEISRRAREMSDREVLESLGPGRRRQRFWHGFLGKLGSLLGFGGRKRA